MHPDLPTSLNRSNAPSPRSAHKRHLEEPGELAYRADLTVLQL